MNEDLPLDLGEILQDDGTTIKPGTETESFHPHVYLADIHLQLRSHLPADERRRCLGGLVGGG
jgi:hypothetical protein